MYFKMIVDSVKDKKKTTLVDPYDNLYQGVKR